jgi:transcriptional regulator with XRE-family HTH domain
MTDLARWLRRELEYRGLTQNSAAVHAGVAVATVSAILNKGHIPKVETLFRLADYFQTPRDDILRLAGHLALGAGGVPHTTADDMLEQELLDEFRRLPDELKEAALQHMDVLIQLARRPPFRILGDDREESERDQEPAHHTGGQAHAA